MQKFNVLLIISFLFFFSSCSKEVKRESIVIEKLILQAVEAYNEGKKVRRWRRLYAAKI